MKERCRSFRAEVYVNLVFCGLADVMNPVRKKQTRKKLIQVSLPKEEKKKSVKTSSIKNLSKTTSDDATPGQRQNRYGRSGLPMPRSRVAPVDSLVSAKTNSSRNRPTQLATILSPKNYTVRPIVPAKKKEVVSVARAMHREEFAPRVQNLFSGETNAALEAIKSGVYIGWRCPEYDWDCIRLSKHSRCFCDHNLSEHASYNKNSIKVKCLAANCNCKAFAFIPERPEDIGEWWLPKRPGFNPSLWRAKCRCKHTHDQHNPNTRKCTVRFCGCFIFESDFLCAACDKHWENHETFFDDLDSRKHKKLPYGQAYLPFHELPDLRNICLTGREDDCDKYNSIASGPYAVPDMNQENDQLRSLSMKYNHFTKN